MEVAVEYIRWLQAERKKVNEVELEDIVFFEDGMKLDIPKKVVSDFIFCGLNNTDFIISGAYLERKE